MPRNSQPLRRERGPSAGTAFRAGFEAGTACLRQKRYAEAIGHLNDALESKPEDVFALSNLGSALNASDRHDEALAAFDRAVAARPGSADLHYNRANTLRALGRREDALRAYAGALALRPSYAEAWVNRGNTLLEMGNEDEALASYESALRIDPRSPEALANSAALLSRMGRDLDALAACDRALRVESRSADIYLMRGQLLARLGRIEPALADFTKATRADPANAKAHVLRGDQLAALGRCEDALKSYERAAVADPGFAEAHDRKGLALVDIGRLEDARRAHERAIALSPDTAGFYYNLTAVAELSADDPNFLAMTGLSRGPRAADDPIPLHFALANAYSDQGNYKAAFRHLREGNGLKRMETDYDERATLADLENVRAIFSAEFLGSHAGHGDPSLAPVFVLGMPRSGSTLIEQILASHPEVHGAGEIDDLMAAAVANLGQNLLGLHAAEDDAAAFHAGLRRIGAGYVQRVRAYGPRAGRIVDKTPDNFRLAGLIRLALPNARIIHTRRDPVDTCLSCYSKLFSSGIPYAYDLGELGRYYRAYDVLMAHWRAALPADVLLEVDYEALVADPETHVRRMLAHCGLDWDPRCLEFHRTPRPVRTASAVQVRRPIYSDAVARAARFGKDLAPLIAALGPSAPEGAVARHFGGTLLDRLRTVGGHVRRLTAWPMHGRPGDRSGGDSPIG